MTRCPTELELEAHLLGPARPDLAPHVEGCTRCRARPEEMLEAVPEQLEAVLALAERSGQKERDGLAMHDRGPASNLLAAARRCHSSAICPPCRGPVPAEMRENSTTLEKEMSSLLAWRTAQLKSP